MGDDESCEELEERAQLLASCDLTIELTRGSLCVLQPSSLDPETIDADPTLPDQRGSGFGYHVIALPHQPHDPPQIWVHFGGTYGRPYDRSTDTVAASGWLDELMERGYTVLQPAYDNKTSIAETCGEVPGVERDNCAAEAREEVLTGQELSPYRDVNHANSIEHRLESVLGHLHSPQHHRSCNPDDVEAVTLPEGGVPLSGGG